MSSATPTKERVPRVETKSAGEPAASAAGNGTVVRSETFVVTIPAKKRDANSPSDPDAASVPVAADASTSLADDRAETPWWRNVALTSWLMSAWGCGSVLYLLLQVIRIRRMSSRLRDAESPPDWLATEIRHWAERLRVTPPKTCLVSGFSSPFLWAFLRTRLIWPRGLTTESNLDAWRGVIVHELAHLKRRDHWVGWLELVAGCVWWWNPLFWYVRGQLRENAELACDAWVVETLPGGRRQYAEALLTVCEHISRPQVPAAAIGVGGARRNLERRLTMILKDRVPFRVSRTLLCVAGALALLILPGWAQPPRNAEPSAPGQGSNSAGRGGSPLIPSRPSAAPSDDSTPSNAAQPKDAAGSGNAVPPQSAADGPRHRRNQDADVAPATTVPRNARDTARRIEQLEKQIRKLQSQLPLRRQEPAMAMPGSPTPSRQSGGQPMDPVGNEGGMTPVGFDGALRRGMDPVGNEGGMTPASNRKEVVATRTITLQRTTYRLPASRAKALEAFLKLHIKAEVLQIEIGTQPARTRKPGAGPAPMGPKGALPGVGGGLGIGPMGAGAAGVGGIGGIGGITGGGLGITGPMGSGPPSVPVITITTTPDVQQAIAGIIALIRKDELPGGVPGSGGGYNPYGRADGIPSAR
jgi:beta-lactamase regulating signal transducer with metallopeptidase domain